MLLVTRHSRHSRHSPRTARHSLPFSRLFSLTAATFLLAAPALRTRPRQAAADVGITVLVLDRYVTFLALGASLPSYVFGLALGVLQLRVAGGAAGSGAAGGDHDAGDGVAGGGAADARVDGAASTGRGADDGMDGGFLERLGSLAHAFMCRAGLSCLAVLAAAAMTLAPHLSELPRLISAWLRAGGGLPIFACALIGAYSGRDPLARLLACWPQRTAPLLRLWLPLLLCVHPAWRAAQLLVGVPVAFPAAVPPAGDWAVAWASPPPPPPPPLAAEAPPLLVGTFSLMLAGGIAVVEMLVSGPLRAACGRLLDSLVATPPAAAEDVAAADRSSSASGTSGTSRTSRTSSSSNSTQPWERLVGYYVAMALTFGVFLSATFSDDEAEWALIANLIGAPRSVQRVLEAVSWLLVMPALALLMGLLGQLLFPACTVHPVPPILPESRSAENALLPVLFWRIVTRGMHPDLVASNVADAFSVLEASGLPRERWEVEVVTDNAMGLAARTRLDVVEIVVPSAYRPPNGCKFKARALHYAAACGASAARRTDWIVHMDEETRFNAATVAHVLQHCMSEHARWVAGQCRHAAIGQGVILYNVTAIESTLCALADTIRVGDDYGKFALQYRVAAQPLIGMHGSFVVCQAAVEIDFGFDHGIEGSITEDTFFAMHVAAHGVQVKWCHGLMFEQSPFGVHDFAKQRCRWYAGRSAPAPRLSTSHDGYPAIPTVLLSVAAPPSQVRGPLALRALA